MATLDVIGARMTAMQLERDKNFDSMSLDERVSFLASIDTLVEAAQEYRHNLDTAYNVTFKYESEIF